MKPRTALIFVALSLVFLAGTATYCETVPQSAQNTQAHADPLQRADNDKSYAKAYCDVAARPLSKIFKPSVLISFFGLLVSWLVWQSTADAERKSLRPYVFVESSAMKCRGTVFLPLPEGAIRGVEQQVYDFALKNYGQTPARSVVVHAWLSIDGGEKIKGSDDPVFGILPPTEPAQLQDRFKCDIPIESFNRIPGFRQRVLSVTGHVSYKDVFGDSHVTRFSYYSCGFDGDNIAGLQVVKFALSETGNDWT
ncbi:MAG TPA: hypothetical protein VEL28_05930 [Candidatus Binatia bacterium]|nr:hypothetical protein [Candidatus Binatia bacterium]